MNTFSAGACMRVGWKTFKRRPWFFIGVTVLFFIVVGLVSYILMSIGRGNVPLMIAMAIIRFLFEMLAVMGLLHFSIKAHDNVESASLADFWHPQDYWQFLGNIILQILFVIGGVIALIIPGIMVSIAVKLSPFFVIDKREGAVEAIFSSVDATRGKRWAFFQFMVLQFIVMVAGFLALGVGILVALPIVMVANVNAYRTLSRTA